MSTDVDALVHWLREQLDAREELILNRWDSDGKARIATMWTGGNPGYTTVATNHFAPGDDCWVADGREITDARHVTVLWDPADELADIAAKRKIIDAWSTWRTESQAAWADYSAWAAGEPHQPEGVRRTLPDDIGPGLEYAIRLLALAFAGRDGWQEAWRP